MVLKNVKEKRITLKPYEYKNFNAACYAIENRWCEDDKYNTHHLIDYIHNIGLGKYIIISEGDMFYTIINDYKTDWEKVNDYYNNKNKNLSPKELEYFFVLENTCDYPDYMYYECAKKYANRKIYSRANKVKKLKDTIKNDIQYEILILSALGYSDNEITRLL